MLNFEKVILHNFGSYGHAEVDLHNKGFCLVSGKNNYKKTTLYQMVLERALFGTLSVLLLLEKLLMAFILI